MPYLSPSAFTVSTKKGPKGGTKTEIDMSTVGIWGFEIAKKVWRGSETKWEDHKNIKKIEIPRLLFKLPPRQECQSGLLGSVFWP